MRNYSELLTMESQSARTVSLLGDSNLLLQDGSLASVKDLAGNFDNKVKIAFRAPHGRVKFETVKNFRPSDLTVDEVTKIYLSNGHVLSATEYDKYVTADGRLVRASALSVDDSVGVLCYNPKTKFLSTDAVKVEAIYLSRLAKGPQFLYDVDFISAECLPLLSGETESGEVSCVTHGNVLLTETT